MSESVSDEGTYPSPVIGVTPFEQSSPTGGGEGVGVEGVAGVPLQHVLPGGVCLDTGKAVAQR